MKAALAALAFLLALFPAVGAAQGAAGAAKPEVKVGDRYGAAYEARMQRKGDARSTVQRRATAVGWEDVEVPAGRFRALRVESEGPFQRSGEELVSFQLQ